MVLVISGSAHGSVRSLFEWQVPLTLDLFFNLFHELFISFLELTGRHINLVDIHLVHEVDVELGFLWQLLVERYLLVLDVEHLIHFMVQEF